MNWISWLAAKYYSIERTILAHERAEFDRARSRLFVRHFAIAQVAARFKTSATQLSAATARLGPAIDEAARAFVALGKLIKEQVEKNGRNQSATDPRRSNGRA